MNASQLADTSIPVRSTPTPSMSRPPPASPSGAAARPAAFCRPSTRPRAADGTRSATSTMSSAPTGPVPRPASTALPMSSGGDGSTPRPATPAPMSSMPLTYQTRRVTRVPTVAYTSALTTPPTATPEITRPRTPAEPVRSRWAGSSNVFSGASTMSCAVTRTVRVRSTGSPTRTAAPALRSLPKPGPGWARCRGRRRGTARWRPLPGSTIASSRSATEAATSCGSSCTAPGLLTQAGSVAVSTAASAEHAAVTHSTSTSSNSSNSPPAAAGPMSSDAVENPVRSPESRSSGIPAAAATSGSSACRAVCPGTSNSAPATPSTMNQVRVRPVAASTSGNAATDAADARSAMMDMRRRPNRSMSTPPARAASSAGTADDAATVPAAVASPVRDRTIHGSAMPTTALPRRDSASASRKRTTTGTACRTARS